VASQISAFNTLPGFNYKIWEQYILDSICSIELSETRSAYKGISKLKPAHFLKQKNGKLSHQHQYWDLSKKEDYGNLTFEEASIELKDKIIEAVRQRCNGRDHYGVELSGGLDSSGIASVLTGITPHQNTVSAFTHTLSPDALTKDKKLKSELDFVAALLNKYKTIRHFKITGENSDGGFNSITNALDCLNKPVNLHYALNADLLFEAAGKSGTSTIFSGLGGDEGITNNGSGYFNELIGKGHHSTLRFCLQNLSSHRGLYRRKLVKLYLDYHIPWLIKEIYPKQLLPG
jgi:asparagine synthase (glutamine-hydrolysing)